jgi:hypothetical protein
MKRWSILFLWFILLGACRKSLPPDETGTPVFTADFLLDGASYQYAAGQENLYMFSFSGNDAQNIPFAAGAFATAQCSTLDCPGTLRFEFLNIGDTLPLLTNLTLPAEIEYSGPITTTQVYNLTLTAPDVPENTYNWLINGTEFQNQRILNITLDNGEALAVTLNTFENGIYRSQVIRKIAIVDPPENYPSVDVNGSLDTLLSQYLLFIQTNSTPLDSVIWFNQVTSYEQLYSDSLPYSIWVTTVSTQNEVAQAAVFNYQGQMPLQFRSTNFSSTVQPITVNSANWGKVNIIWTDGNGREWRSDRALQTDPQCIITDVSDYPDNENGEKTLKITVSYRCRLFNTDGEFMTIEGQATLAVVPP